MSLAHLVDTSQCIKFNCTFLPRKKLRNGLKNNGIYNRTKIWKINIMKYVNYLYRDNFKTLRETKGLIRAGIHKVHDLEDSEW